jgi:hypothetical protein
MGWAGTKNGKLLTLMMEENFTILLTTDQNLRHQQNLEEAGVAIVVMVAQTNRLPDLILLVPNVCAALESIEPGEVIEISI